jgi:hypothetical protein
MSDDFEILDTQEVALNNLQVFQQDKAMIERMMEWAYKHPRNPVKVTNNCIAMIASDMELAESCTFSVSKGGKNITGPSIVLAKLIAREMGNIRCEQRVVGYDDTHVTSEAICFDLEKNFAIRTQIKRSIVGSRGQRYSEDMAVITGNAGSSIALRNAIFAVLDPFVVKKVHTSAKNKVTGDLSDESKLIARRTAIVNGFLASYSSLNLTDREIAGAVGKTLVEHINADDILTLIGFEKSLAAGEIAFESVFRKTVANPMPTVTVDKSLDRLKKLMESATTRKDLEKFKKDIKGQELSVLYDALWSKLS